MASSEDEVSVSKSSSFEEQFKDLTSLITFFEHCSLETQEFINEMRAKLCDSIETDLITETERQRLLSYTAKKATLLVVGQTNSGKSSFVNELLGGSFMPTSEVPCTSRIVRLKYSDDNYYQVLSDSISSEGTSKTVFSKKKLPKEAIELDERKRGDPLWVNAVVEVGLNNPLLQSGHLEVIDAPGMSENESLDKIVDECIHGVLQVIVYVIDGNSSFRLQERGFLLRLKEKVGNLPIFYVCNKVDEDQKAREFDRDSESDEDEETKPRSGQQKIDLAYQALAKCHMVPNDVHWEKCPFFHGLSSKEVRNARIKKATSQFTEQFDALKAKLLKFAAIGVNAHLKSGTELLCQIQDRVFDLFLTHNLKEGGIPVQDDLFGNLEGIELEYYWKMTNYLSGNTSKIASLIEGAIKSERKRIEREAGEMQFDSIKIGDVVGRNEVVEQCRKQIKDIVLFKVMDISMAKVKDTLNLISARLRSALEKAFDDVAKQDNRLVDLVKRQLEYSFFQHFQERNTCHHFDYALMKFGVKFADETKQAVSNVLLAITGKATHLNQKWKEGVAKAVLEGIDCSAIAERILANVQGDLNSGHSLFLANLGSMKIFCATAGKQSDAQQTFAAEKAPYFSRLMSNASALHQTLVLEIPSRVVIGSRLGREGHRGHVCEVQGNGKLVAKQLRCEESLEDEHLLGITKAFRRIQNDVKRVLKPVSVKLDKSNKITVVFPRMSIDLFDRLTKCLDVPIYMIDGLRIVQQMIEALENCWDRGLYEVDLRITNVMLDHHNNAQLNVSKPRNDSIPYPDEKAPFHVPADRNPGQRNKNSAAALTLKTHSVYSLAVLLWLLLEQKYFRPDYAMTTNVTQVYDAIAQQEDSKFIKLLIRERGQQSCAKRQALEVVVSVFNAQKEEGVLWSFFSDNFKSLVQNALSSCDVEMESSV